MNHVVPTSRCPNRDTWSGFYAGKVNPDSLPPLVTHLDHCSTCQGVLHTLARATVGEADALVSGLRGASRRADAYEDEPECRRAVERVRALVPGSSSAESAPLAPVPEQLGGYRVLQLIGRGGMGAVYRARHVRLGRAVALKVLPPDRARDVAAARFQREMIAHGKLDHPNVIRATDAGEADGVTFLVMDLVDGIDLDRLVRARGPVPVADACELARQAALGLGHLAEHGLVHRDVKPSNLILSRGGEVKVLDLGLAARTDLTEAAPALTGYGEIIGTFDYLAPEQADPVRPVDARADVYGLGCSLYYLLTGAPPYSGPAHATARNKVLAHAAGPVPQVRDARPDVPADLASVLARALAKAPEERFPNAAAVAAALTPFCAGADLGRLLVSAGLEPSAGLPAPHDSTEPDAPTRLLRRAPRRTRATPITAALFMFLIVAGGLGTAVTSWLQPPERPSIAANGVTTDPPMEGPAAAADHQPAPKQGAKRVPAVALVGFEERGAGAKDLGAKVGDLVFAKLATRPGLVLVDRGDLKKVLDEQALNLSGAVKADGAVKVGQLTGAEVLVAGSVVQVDKRMYLVAKVIGTETGRVVGASVDGPASDDLGALAGRLAEAIDEALTAQGPNLVPRAVPRADRLAELNARLGAGARPVIAAQVNERHLGPPAADPAAQTEVTKVAKDLGFEVIDADEAGRGRADVLLIGEGFSEAGGRVGDLISVRARVELRAVDRKTGKVLAVDRQTVVVVDLSEQVAGKSALQAAAGQLAERVLPKLVAPGMKK